MRQPPVIVIGGGPAGCAAAIGLARAGHAPVLLERASGPVHKVCGDFMSGDAIDEAAALGVDPHGLGGQTLSRMRVVHRGRCAETHLPFAAIGLSRRSLDAALLRAAQQAGVDIRLGETVRHLTREDGSWLVQAGDTLSLRTGAVLLATGKHDLRDMPRPNRTRGSVGMKMYYRPTPAGQRHLAGTIELTLFRGGYAGVQPVEDGCLNLCLAARADTVRALGWDGLLLELAANNPETFSLLAEATPLLARPLAIANIPYGHLARPATSANLFRLGDQAAVIPSLTGDGMAIALHSGLSAAEAWLHGIPADRWQRALADRLSPQMRIAGLLHRVALSPATQAAATRVPAMLPGLLRLFASQTRLPGRCLARNRSGRPAAE